MEGGREGKEKGEEVKGRGRGGGRRKGGAGGRVGGKEEGRKERRGLDLLQTASSRELQKLAIFVFKISIWIKACSERSTGNKDIYCKTAICVHMTCAWFGGRR